jgi:NitT/TauT family transport system permease protein
MKKITLKSVWQGAIIPVIIILVWFFASSAETAPTFVFPPLQNVILGFLDFAFGFYDMNIHSGTMFSHLWASAGRVFFGFSIATALGLLFGYLSGCSKTVFRFVSPTINFLRSIPGIAWLPISIVWFGVGNDQSIFLISLAAFFPVFSNTCHGAATVDRELIDASRLCGATPISCFKYVIFPLSMPTVAVGLRVGLGLSWAYLVLGEMTGVNVGIGAVMQDARMLGHVHIIIISMLVIALAAAIFDGILRILFKLLMPQGV